MTEPLDPLVAAKRADEIAIEIATNQREIFALKAKLAQLARERDEVYRVIESVWCVPA